MRTRGFRDAAARCASVGARQHLPARRAWEVQAWGDNIQRSWSDHLTEVRQRISARKARHDAKVAEEDAENAEGYAEFAIDFAYSAIEEAEYAVLDAALARADADAAASA
jgi:hypothetical protein